MTGKLSDRHERLRQQLDSYREGGTYAQQREFVDGLKTTDAPLPKVGAGGWWGWIDNYRKWLMRRQR